MMKPQHLLFATTTTAICAAVLPTMMVAAFSTTVVRPTFLGSSLDSSSVAIAATASSKWRMDIESDLSTDVATVRYNLEQTLQHSSLRHRQHQPSSNIQMHPPLSTTPLLPLQQPQQRTGFVSVDEAEAAHGMPWKTSIDPKMEGDELLYMPFWEWQMRFMKDHLTDLRAIPCTDGNHQDFSYQENTKKKARIVNLCATSKEYRKIRMSYYDAGDNTQVFNSVWYPDPAYNLPVLGIDLLAFNRKKYLAIVDFQPLYTNEADHAMTYEHLLQPIKEQYDTLKGRMSSKFYDETKFFSQQMLFARFEDESVITKELFPAFTQYVQTHLQLLQSTEANVHQAKHVLERQKAYDTYSAERDPATGLFAAMFGADWAQDFVHGFLFSMSERTTTPASASTTNAGPVRSSPPVAGVASQPHPSPPAAISTVRA